MINHQILRWIWWRIWWWIWWITRWGDEFITIFGDVVNDDFCYLHQIESFHKSIFPTKKHSEGKRHPTNTRSWTFRGKKTSHDFGDIFITKFGWWFWWQIWRRIWWFTNFVEKFDDLFMTFLVTKFVECITKIITKVFESPNSSQNILGSYMKKRWHFF